MKSFRAKSPFICGFLLAAIIGGSVWHYCTPRQPEYSGKRLSVWLHEVRALHQYSEIAKADHPQVRAIRAIGTNAIPWLVKELRKPPPLRWRLNRILERQRVLRYRFPIPTKGDYQHLHQSQAVCGFWALGEIAEPAIPTLRGLLEEQPEFVTTSLAGIGTPALPTLEYCLTNITPNAASNPRNALIAGHSVGALFGALKAGRISPSEAAFLLPVIRGWSKSTNAHAAFWANAILKEDYRPKPTAN